MGEMTDVGYFGVEVGFVAWLRVVHNHDVLFFVDICVQLARLNVRFQDFATDDMVVRVDVEIVGGGDAFKWQVAEPSVKAGTETLKAYKELEEDTGSTTNEKSFLLGFDSFYRRSQYISLDSSTMNALSNASVVYRVIRVDDNPAPPANAPPPKKGQPPPPVQPVDETLFELWVPFANLLTVKGSLFDFDGYLDSPDLASMGAGLRSVKQNLMLSQSRISWKVFADDDLAEYVIGSSIVRWSGATMANPPVAWSLHAGDVVDPKAKVQPKAADLRAKYLENIAKLVETQEKVCSYGMTIASTVSQTPPEVEDIREEEPMPPLLPTLTLSNGRVKFDAVAASAVPVEEDIRNMPGLWSGRCPLDFGNVCYFYLLHLCV
jgi:hypothetical protein